MSEANFIGPDPKVPGSVMIAITSRLGWPWNRHDVTTVYSGSGTVWRDIETGCRAVILREAWLADLQWSFERKQKGSEYERCTIAGSADG